jgi:hypothetical protein
VFFVTATPLPEPPPPPPVPPGPTPIPTKGRILILGDDGKYTYAPEGSVVLPPGSKVVDEKIVEDIHKKIDELLKGKSQSSLDRRVDRLADILIAFEPTMAMSRDQRGLYVESLKAAKLESGR